MDGYDLDPYEQQLLKVFNSHDRENCGSLDVDGLTQLCQTLQLEDHGVDLVKCLLKDKISRVNFNEFKDALLALLGNMQNSKTQKSGSINEEKSSPDREVSPKFVYGSKKYGRRSRPRNDDVNNIINEEQNKLQNNVSVQRSNSNTEVSSKKRKTNYRLQRCTSLPSRNDIPINNSDTSNLSSTDVELVCTEEMLREAWKKLGVGKNGYLNQNELILVCEAVGLHKLADGVIRQLSDKLTVNCDHKISFQELLTILQQDDTWFEVLNQTVPNKDETIIQTSNEGLFPDSRTFHLVTLGPDGNGMISADSLIEMWESVGVHSPKELLHELGFNCRMINVLDLADILDKQIKGATEATRSEFQSPHVAVLQASLTLYQSEIKTFKNLLEQLHAEREKLKCHLTDANNRAMLLAQEVDDNHSRMEQNTLNQVKLLEQRQADILKDITGQFTKDKEQLVNINQILEEKISSLEREVNKLKNDLQVAQKYSLNIERENQNLLLKIAELERDRSFLSTQIDNLEKEKQKFTEMEQEENKLLITKLTTLQMENAQLKDKNDEMVSEIDSLTSQVATIRMKGSSSTPANFNTLDQSMEENISIISEGVGLGAKRRSDHSPFKENHFFRVVDRSPRLGKIRKFAIKHENLQAPFTSSSESGFDTEAGCLDSSSSSSTNDNDDVMRLRSKVAFLEQILKQNGIPVPASSFEGFGTSWSTNPDYLSTRVQYLEKVIKLVKEAMRVMIEKDTVNCDNLKMVREKLEQTLLGNNDVRKEQFDFEFPEKACCSSSSQTDFINEFEEKVNKLENDNKELCTKCSELEKCVDLLRNEYEKCEDYWQNKVDEERQMYEAEQRINSDKLTELLLKMQEYEEQYADKDVVDNRLPTIEETGNLEKQFTDLEEEFEIYKEESECMLLQKDQEIKILKDKLTELALRQQEAHGKVDTEERRIINRMQSLSSHIVENTNRLSEEMSSPTQFTNPQSPVWNQQSTPRAYANSQSLPVHFNLYNSRTDSNGPSSSCSTTSLDQSSISGTPCRPKRTKKYTKNIYKKNNQSNESKNDDTQDTPSGKSQFQSENPNLGLEQRVIISLRSFHNLNARRSFLEQRVRHLQMCLQQQKFCNEQTLQRFWHQFNGERTDLHSKLKYLQDKLDHQVRISREQLDKLEKTDMLVKDLYVENSYLIASVQRLEQRCHMLTHCNNSSSV